MSQAKQQRVIVMTGVTGGFGAKAARLIAEQPDTRVIVGARDVSRVPGNIESLPLDLASLASVREFVIRLTEQLAERPIDILILNAGTHLAKNDRRSADGFELTFAVNHLAHYLLARSLLPHLAEGGRLLITTSDTHDPAVTGMAPRSLAPQQLAHPTTSGFGTGVKAYASSKLCNLMTAQTLAAHPEIQSRGISVIAFSPGLTSGSAGRDSPVLLRRVVQVLMQTVFHVLGLFRPAYAANPPERSGASLADFALGNANLPSGHIYVALVKGKPTFPEPSELARSQSAQQQLWRDSAAMVGIDYEA
nr:SDR family NAD(P)-dependent oxidoreductase [Pseudomonas sp. ALS1131]